MSARPGRLEPQSLAAPFFINDKRKKQSNKELSAANWSLGANCAAIADAFKFILRDVD
jgi:hypothetical protein